MTICRRSGLTCSSSSSSLARNISHSKSASGFMARFFAKSVDLVHRSDAENSPRYSQRYPLRQHLGFWRLLNATALPAFHQVRVRMRWVQSCVRFRLGLRSVATTRAPRSANANAIARPIPWPASVNQRYSSCRQHVRFALAIGASVLLAIDRDLAAPP